MLEIKYFVWLNNNHGVPEAQIWYDKQTDGNGKAKETLFIKELANDDRRSLGHLIEAYPIEVAAP